MRILKDIRSQNIIAGVEQSGKTFYAEQLGKRYAGKGGCTFVYNRGRERDFSDYEPIEILSIQDHERLLQSKVKRREYKRYPFIAYFMYQGHRIPFKRFYEFSRGKKLMCYRVGDRQTERLLFQAMFWYMADTLIIFDDARPIFRQGLTAEHITLFSRKNHAGIKTTQPNRGVDISMIFHNLDKVTTEAYDYATHLTMFKTTRLPDRGHVDNDQLADLIEQAYTKVNAAKKYSFAQINIRGENPYTYSINQPIKL